MSVVLDLLGAVEGVEHLGFTAGSGAKCGGTFRRFPNKMYRINCDERQ